MMLRLPFRLAPLLLLATSIVSGADARYVVRFSDGSRHEGNAYTNWHEENARPHLDGRQLLDDNNPFRWLLDRSLNAPSEPGPGVEFVTGDFLPCQVIGYRASGPDFDPAPPHLIVDPSITQKIPSEASPPSIRILMGNAKRIVWQRRENERYEPGTVFLRDRRSYKYRALRWLDGAVSILDASGNHRVPFGDVAEIHLPVVDFWKAYFDEVAVLSPQGKSRLHQVETTEGLIATASFERTIVQKRGNGNEPHQWVHGLQPAWSLDILWVTNDRIRLRRTFAPHEVPLSRVPPTTVKHQAILSGVGTIWRGERNVQGEPLRSGGREFGFGIGTNTTVGLLLPLPRGAKSLRGSVGLDRLAGKGGCAKVEIHCGPSADSLQKLWESPVMQGSEQVHDFGPLNLPASDKPQQLALASLAAHEGRPSGADPFEIRDLVDWLDPVLDLDPAVVKEEVQKRMELIFPALVGWNVQSGGESSTLAPKFASFLDKNAFIPGRFRTTLQLERPLIYRRVQTLGPRDRWLLVLATTPEGRDSNVKIEIRVDDELLAEGKAPTWNEANREVRALTALLPPGRRNKQESLIEIRQLHAPGSAPIELRAVRIVDQIPTRSHVMEEENVFTATAGSPKPELIETDRFFGVRSVRLAKGSEVRVDFEKPIAIRNVPSWNEFRLFRYAMRKKGGGHLLLTLVDNDPSRSITFTAGPVEKGRQPDPFDVWNQELPDAWNTIYRDLYGDGGEHDFIALKVSVPDGESAIIDSIYFSTSHSDLDAFMRFPLPELANRPVLTELPKPVRERVDASLVQIDYGEGRVFDGVVTLANGEILTVGHGALAANREATVRAANGKTYKAKTLGVCRDRDVALLKITEQVDLPIGHLYGPDDLQLQWAYMAMAHPAGPIIADPPEARGASIARVLRGVVTTTFDFPAGRTGGPLIDNEGRVVGVLTRHIPDVGAAYAPLAKWGDVEGRLRNGEVWGKWLPGSEPSWGAKLHTDVDGAVRIAQVDAKGPAAKEGVKVGDTLLKLDGMDVRSLDDAFGVLSDRDPGREITLDLARGKEPRQIRVKLEPRSP